MLCSCADCGSARRRGGSPGWAGSWEWVMGDGPCRISPWTPPDFSFVIPSLRWRIEAARPSAVRRRRLPTFAPGIGRGRRCRSSRTSATCSIGRCRSPRARRRGTTRRRCPGTKRSSRFFATLGRFDAFLASETPLSSPPEQLFQGPVADALNHVGQITMLRRLAGAPIRGENYAKADIVTGRTGAEQTVPKVEFD